MVKHVELIKPSKNEQKFSHEIEKQILQKITEISQGDDLKRVGSTRELVKILIEKQKLISKGDLCKELSYSINRFIRGLASNRLNARIGFSVALCELLQTFPVITTELVLKSIKEQLASNKEDSQFEVAAKLIGRVFAYLALIQCERLDSTNVKEILKDVLEIRKKKSYLAEIGTQTSVLIAQKSTEETFKTYVWPEIKEELSSGWEGCKPETLHLLMACRNYQSAVVRKKFLKAHWNSSKIFNELNYSQLLNVLVKYHRGYPGIHMLIPAVVEEIVKSPENIDSFWLIISNKLLPDSLFKKKIALNICALLLENTTSAEQAANFITPELCQVFVRALPDEKRELHNICLEVVNNNFSDIKCFMTTTCSAEGNMTKLGFETHVFNSVLSLECNKMPSAMLKHCRWHLVVHKTKKIIVQIEKSKDGALQYDVIKRFTKHFKAALFDFPTLTALISGLIKTLPAEGANLLKKDLFKTLDGKGFHTEDEHNSEKITVWALESIRDLVTIQGCGSDHSLQITLLQFLFLKSFFIVKQSTKDIPHCKNISTLDFSDRVQITGRDCFLKALNKLSTFQQVASKKRDLPRYINTVFEIAQYAKLLLQNQEIVILRDPISEEVRTTWDKTIEVVETIHDKRKDDEKLDKHGAFELLFLYTSLQLLNTEPDASVALLKDMHVCYEKACSRKRKHSEMTEEEPEWIEVITEVLMSMLVQPSNLAKVISHTVFTHLVSHITREAVAVILNVFQSQKEETTDESEGDRSEEGLESSEDSSSDDSQSDDDDNHSDMDVDSSVRQTIKSALGKAAAPDDEESGDDEDLSDSEMFKRDSILAEAFRSMVKDKKDKETQKQKEMVVFKLKVIDMLEIIVKEGPSAGIVLDIIEPLLNLIEIGIQKKDEKLIGKKATCIFELLYKAKIEQDQTVKPDEILYSIRELIKYRNKVTDIAMVKRVSNAVFILIRMLLNTETSSDPSPVKTTSTDTVQPKVNEGLQNQMLDIIESSLQHSLSRRLDHMATEFFQNLFMKHPMMFSPISATLLSALNDDNVKVLNKTQACILLSTLMNRRSFELNTLPKEKFSEIFPPILEKELNESYKPKLLKNLLTVFNKYLIMCKEDAGKLVSDDLLKKMEFLKKSNDTDLRNLTKKVVNNCNKFRNSAQPQKNESHKRKSIDTESEIQKNKIKTSSDTAIEEQNFHEEDGENISQNSHTKKRTSTWLSENSSGDAEDLSVFELSSSSKKKRKKRKSKDVD